jgi:hypothetical protein
MLFGQYIEFLRSPSEPNKSRLIKLLLDEARFIEQLKDSDHKERG